MIKFISKIFRLIPSVIPGKMRLAKAFLYRIPDQEAEINASNCKLIVPSLKEPIAFHLLANGVYEPETTALLMKALNPGSVFVDVGANIGIFTVLAAKRVGPSGTVIAIESSPKIFPYLHKNVSLNSLSNVRVKQCAAYDQCSNLPFYEAPADHFGMGSLSPQFHAQPISVVTQTLDHILEEEKVKRVDVLKVDVEGFEAAVFKGARQLLTGKNPPLIVFEFCDWAEARVPEGKVGDAQQVLKEWGYQIWSLSDFLRNKRSLSNIITKGSVMLVARKK